MGFKLIDLLNLRECMKTLNLSFADVDLIELGEQEFKIWPIDILNLEVNLWLKSKPREWPLKISNRYGYFTKDFFNFYCRKCTTIDIECHCKDSHIINLELDIRQQGINDKYDILTNCGTTEHVGQITSTTSNPQYYAFKNIHQLVKKGGLFFHVVPFAIDIDHLLQHGAFCYHYSFFEQLAEKCNYTILHNEVDESGKRSNFLNCFMVKNQDNSFISEQEFNQLSGLWETDLRIKQR